MPTLSPTKRFIALFALALGGFGIGTSEFVSMGLLPLVAADLIPEHAAQPNIAIAHAGWLITAYALGVVVGAPLTAIFTAKLPQHRLTIVLAVALGAGALTSALMPNLELTVAARFVAGLPHGAYFGVASLLAARIMGPGRQGAGVALALSGLTIANVVGVPLGTWLGQVAGWRWAYVVVAVVFALTALLGAATLPRVEGDTSRTASSELRALRSRRLWLMIAVASIGFGGFFAVYSYIAETTTRVAGLAEATVPWVLMTLGIGMTVGNVLGGWASDHNLTRTVIGGFSAFIVALVAFALLAEHPVWMFATLFCIGAASSTLVPAIQSRIIQISGDAALLGAAVNHAAFNVGNALGAWLGGVVIAAGLGYVAPAWVGVALAVLGCLLALWSIAGDRLRARERQLVAESKA